MCNIEIPSIPFDSVALYKTCKSDFPKSTQHIHIMYPQKKQQSLTFLIQNYFKTKCPMNFV